MSWLSLRLQRPLLLSNAFSSLLFNVGALANDLQNSTPTLRSRGKGANITLYATIGHSTCFIFHYEFIFLLRYKSLCAAPFEEKPRFPKNMHTQCWDAMWQKRHNAEACLHLKVRCAVCPETCPPHVQSARGIMVALTLSSLQRKLLWICTSSSVA